MLRISIFVLFLFAVVGCGGSADDGQTSPRQVVPDSPSTPDISPTTWQEGVFSPSDNFHQTCADPGNAYDRGNAIQGTYVDENNWLRSFTHKTYLWYDEIADTDPACCSTPDYFKLMKTLETTASGNPKDRFSFSENTRKYLDSQKGVTFGYGFLIGRAQEGFYILHVEPGSPADNAGLARGTLISEIDDIPVGQLSSEQLLSTLFPSSSERHGFTILIPGESRPRSVTMTSAEVVKTPVLTSVLINRAGTFKIGYMLFNDHIPPAEAGLINAVRHFDREDIDELVLDLRYNGGGLVSIASGLAFMIAGSRATENRLFTKFVTNGKTPSESLPFYNYSTSSRPLPTLNLERVFVLTGGRTCSASELIINSLRGIGVEVVLIGETTCGKPFGFVGTDNCGTTYFPIQFRFVNDRGFGDYEDGFLPTCRARDDVFRPLGDSEEARLGEAITYMFTGECTSQQGDQARVQKRTEEPSLESPEIIEIWPPMMPRAIVD